MDSPPAEAFTVGLIYIKPLEMLAITPMLDERFAPLPVAHEDLNDYILGRVGDHNVIIVGPARGDQGTVATAHFITTVNLTFPNVIVGLLVGIGGGIPHPQHDIRLGDVVVGAPEGDPAVVQYDLGRRTFDGFELTGSLPKPPSALLNVVNIVQAKFELLQDGEADILKPHLDRFSKYPRLKEQYQRPSVPDRLFKSSYIHRVNTDCIDHEQQFEAIREGRKSDHVYIHYGTILSGNTLMKSSVDRDLIIKQHKNALCFEMEAAGLMKVFPCLVIRGISDYSDSHKNDAWQKYAAATAAAYAREILLNMSKRTPRASGIVRKAKAERKQENSPIHHAIFSGSENHGSQVGHNFGRVTNNFGGR